MANVLKSNPSTLSETSSEMKEESVEFKLTGVYHGIGDGCFHPHLHLVHPQLHLGIRYFSERTEKRPILPEFLVGILCFM
jgi:hypothetical protein